MFKIKEFSVEKLMDPLGILTDDTYEFLIYLEVDKEDELFVDGGVGIKMIFGVHEGIERIKQYNFFRCDKQEPLDFALEEDEEVFVLQFCKERYQETES